MQKLRRSLMATKKGLHASNLNVHFKGKTKQNKVHKTTHLFLIPLYFHVGFFALRPVCIC